MLDKIIELKFSDVKVPEFNKKVSGKPWMQFGENNDYPDYLLSLYNKSSKHNAIVNGKVNYILGNGLKAEGEDPAATAWLDKVNGYSETMADLAKKSILDIELFGGFIWEVMPDQLGNIESIYHSELRKWRSDKKGETFYFKHNWKDTKEEPKVYPAFKKGSTVPTVFFYAEYRPGVDTYCLPNYLGAINYIESDVEVSKHTLTNAKTGFSASKFINFYNGEPTEEAKKKITQRFEDRTTGSEGKKLIIGFNNDPAKKPTIDDLGVSDLTKEDFAHVDNLISQNIYAGHQVTSPILFGIKSEGQLGGHNELRIAYEIFKKTYVTIKQQQFERVLTFFAGIKGITAKITFIPSDPVGVEFTDQTILQAAPLSWVQEQMGIDTSKYTDAPVGRSTTPRPEDQPTNTAVNGAPSKQSEMVNDNVKNLTAKQHQQLLRIIRQYTKGQLNETQARTLLKTSLGLSDEEITSLLGIEEDAAFAAQYTEEDVAEMFAECGEGRQAFEVIETRKAFFESDRDVLESELLLREQFADDELQDKGILDKIKEAIGIKKKLPQIFVKYSYEPRPGLEPVIATTRPFCKKLIELDRFYSRVEIEKISERLGYSVWDRRGGFWGHKPYCRHTWKQHVVVKK